MHALDPLNYDWASNATTYEWRKFLKETLLIERKYKSDLSGRLLYNTCHMHEGILQRSVVPKNLWWQILIFHPYNSFLLLPEEHIPCPPSRAWCAVNAFERYGKEAVVDWFYSLPFKRFPFKIENLDGLKI
jgi:hypothetical protein